MDYQCLFEPFTPQALPPRYGRSDKGWEGLAKVFPPEPGHFIQYRHFDSYPANVLVHDSSLSLDRITAAQSNDERERPYSKTRLLISPSWEALRDKHGRLTQYNPGAPIPFSEEAFLLLVEKLHFHKACLSNLNSGQVARICGPQNITCTSSSLTAIYIESFSYRASWQKLSIAYMPNTMTTNLYLHNLDSSECRYILQRLSSQAIQHLLIHPLLVPIIVYEILYNFSMKQLAKIFHSAIQTEHERGLNNNNFFQHFRNNQTTDDEAATRTYGESQSLCSLRERMEFNIMLGHKLRSYFSQLVEITPDGPHKEKFRLAGETIKDRLEYLLDCFELKMPRLRRAQAHLDLNRSGLDGRVATRSNDINYRIATESKADSTAMKSIAVLTMLFLPATFLATFFAMPFFDWDSSSSIVTDKFWIFWAVTVPFTILVLVIWQLWAMYINRGISGAHRSVKHSKSEDLKNAEKV